MNRSCTTPAMGVSDDGFEHCCIIYCNVSLSNGVHLIMVTRSNMFYVIARLFFECQTPQSGQKFLLPKSVVHYLCHLKSNNIIVQRKTTNKEKHFYPWLTLFELKLSWTQLILANSKYLLKILYIYCTNWLRVI